MEFSSIQRDALREISSIGAGNAATALAQFIARKIEMATPEILEVSAQQPGRLLNQPARNLMLVMLGIEGPVSGHIMLISEYTNAQFLVDCLMGREAQAAGAELSEIDISSVKEVASVMSGSFLRVISETLNTVLRMTPPDLISGSPEDITELISKHCLWEPEPTLCLRSGLWIVSGHMRVSFNLLFIPMASSLKPLLSFLGM